MPLRPHVKTAKSLEIARAIHGGKPGPITVSTLREAEYFFAAGFTDILYAVGIVPGKLPRAAKLITKGCDLKLVLDHPAMVSKVSEAGTALGTAFSVLVEINSDGDRAGLRPDDPAAVTVAQALAEAPGTRFAGYMTHAGGAYHLDSAQKIRDHAVIERDAVLTCAAQARAAGLVVDIVSVGSTPTATYAEDLSGVTEVRAGVYVFQDLCQTELGVCRVDDVALHVLTSIIGHRVDKGWLLVDAGALALSKDLSGGDDPHYGVACHNDGTLLPALKVRHLNQEHGIIVSDAGPIDFDEWPVGSTLRILPVHACLTAAAHASYALVEGDQVTGRWDRCNFW